MARKILILGGAGFIGTEVVRYFGAQPGTEITAVDDLSRGILDEDARLTFEQTGARFIQADLTDAAQYDKLGSGYDEIYLLAGVVGVRYTIEVPDRVLWVTAQIIMNTMEYWRKTGGRLVYCSSSEVYGGGQDIVPDFPLPTPETVPLFIPDIRNVRFSYAVAKMFGEANTQAYAQRYGLPGVIVRYHNVYGPRMGYEHVVPELSLRLIRGEEPFVLFGSDQTRAFCYISDAVRGTCAAAAQASAKPEIFHIGNDHEVTITELFDRLQAVSGIHPKVVQPQAAPAGSPRRRCPDISRMRNVLGVEPQVSLDEGLKLSFDWYRARHPDGRKPKGRE